MLAWHGDVGAGMHARSDTLLLRSVPRLAEEARDALELAIVSGAPSELVDRLALASGLLHAIADLSSDSPPLTALTSSARERATIAMDAWRTWQRGLLPRTG